MYIEIVPNRNSRPTILLREAWREGRKVRKRTVANLTGWPDAKITALRLLLKGEPLIHPTEAFIIEESLSCGHVHAILKLTEKIRLRDILGPGPKLNKNIIMTMVIHTFLLQNAPHLADSLWHGTTLLEDLGLHSVTTDDVADTLEWLTGRRAHIERQLEAKICPSASAVYDQMGHDTAYKLLHLLAEFLNINLHQVLKPLLSQDTIQDNVCLRAMRNKNPFTIHTYEIRLVAGMHKEWGHALSLFEIIDHLTAQCRVRCRISSIPGGMTVNLITPASPIQTRVFGLIEAYDGKGINVETTSRNEPRMHEDVHVREQWKKNHDTQDYSTE